VIQAGGGIKGDGFGQLPAAALAPVPVRAAARATAALAAPAPTQWPAERYGSMTSPAHPGSGGAPARTSSSSGGQGGGAIRLVVSNLLVLDGIVSADGGTGYATNSPTGGGSGGSLWITAGTLSGAGSISACGGSGVNNGGGGGGGRNRDLYRDESLQRNHVRPRRPGLPQWRRGNHLLERHRHAGQPRDRGQWRLRPRHQYSRIPVVHR